MLAFIEMDPTYSRDVMANVIYMCVTEWKIEKKSISIILDDASNNDGVVNSFTPKFLVRKGMDMTHVCCFYLNVYCFSCMHAVFT